MKRLILARHSRHYIFVFLLLIAMVFGSKVTQSPAWTFGGKVGKTLSNVVVNSGSDGVGSYQEIDFNYQDLNNTSRGGGIRAYSSNPIVLFTDSFMSSGPNSASFPKLSTFPTSLYRMSYNCAFA